MTDTIAKAHLVALLAKFYRGYEAEQERQSDAGHDIFAARAKGGASAVAQISMSLGLERDVLQRCDLGTMQ